MPPGEAPDSQAQPRPRMAASPDPETPTPDLADPGETQPRHAKKFYDESEQNKKITPNKKQITNAGWPFFLFLWLLSYF